MHGLMFLIPATLSNGKRCVVRTEFRPQQLFGGLIFMEQPDNSTANYQNNYPESINKHLKNIADQQKRQTDR